MPFSDENWEALRNNLQNFIDSQYLIFEFILRFRSIFGTHGSHDHIDRFFMHFFFVLSSELHFLLQTTNTLSLI